MAQVYVHYGLSEVKTPIIWRQTIEGVNVMD